MVDPFVFVCVGSEKTAPIEEVPWWNFDWQYRKKIIINHSEVDSDLTNFPLLIGILDNDLRDDSQNNGNDIVFINNSGNKLHHEIESFNGDTGELFCWVNLTYLSSTENTTIYLYYGNPLCENQENPTNVWDSNYKMVQHLDETTGLTYDSTIFANDGTPSADLNMTVLGKINGADSFNGTTDYITIPYSTSLLMGSGDFTIETWIKTLDSTNAGQIVGTYPVVGTTITPFYFLALSAPGKVRAFMRDSDSDSAACTSITQINDDQWHYITGVRRGNTIYIYVDSIEENSNTNNNVGSTDNSYDNAIGRHSSTGAYSGLIDEVRISNNARTTDWINTSFNNQDNRSKFYYIEAEESTGRPYVINEIPQHQSGNVGLNPILSVQIYDTQNMDITFRTNASGSWQDIGSNLSVGNGTYSQITNNIDSYDSVYWWSVNVTDGEYWTNNTYWFITKDVFAVKNGYNDFIQEFLTKPASWHYNGIFNRTYIAWMENTGNINIGYYDHHTGVFSNPVLIDTIITDDHGSPSLIIRNDGHIIIFHTGGHNDPMYCWISSNPEDISSWGSRITIDTGSCDYPRAFENTSGTILLLYRYGDV